jgi:hypothetical protein
MVDPGRNAGVSHIYVVDGKYKIITINQFHILFLVLSMDFRDQ